MTEWYQGDTIYLMPDTPRLLMPDGEILAIVDLREKKNARSKQKNDNFYMVDQLIAEELTTNNEVSHFEIRVLWFLCNRMDMENVVHKTQAEIARDMGVPPSQISRALKSLEETGYVRADGRGKFIIDLELAWRSSKKDRDATVTDIRNRREKEKQKNK